MHQPAPEEPNEVEEEEVEEEGGGQSMPRQQSASLYLFTCSCSIFKNYNNI
jgi:hypothetical protein